MDIMNIIEILRKSKDPGIQAALDKALDKEEVERKASEIKALLKRLYFVDQEMWKKIKDNALIPINDGDKKLDPTATQIIRDYNDIINRLKLINHFDCLENIFLPSE